MSQPEQTDAELPRSTLRPRQGESFIRVEDTAEIRDVILDRRSMRNAITVDMYRAMTDAFRDAAANDRIQVIVLGSVGGAFSIGDDAVEAKCAALCSPWSDGAREFLLTLASFPKPVVAAVNGLAVGTGATMLLHCDLVIASQFAAFEFSSARLGMVPDDLSSMLLAGRVGLQRASEWLLFGDRIDAATALRVGLVNAIVPLENLAASARARAEALLRLPQRAVRETKRVMHEPLQAALRQAGLALGGTRG